MLCLKYGIRLTTTAAIGTSLRETFTILGIVDKIYVKILQNVGIK